MDNKTYEKPAALVKPTHTIELYDLIDHPDGITIGYRITHTSQSQEWITDADYLAHSLAETLSHIGRLITLESK